MAWPLRSNILHTNFYFLRQLTQQLATKLAGFTLVSCFSQNKEELIFEFNNTKDSFFIKASLQAHFCCLSFPETFHRARKNSIDLFNEVLMKEVIQIKQYENERSFSVHLQDAWILLFKMHGNRANIILFQNNKAVRLFRNNLQADLEIQLDKLDKANDWSKEYFLNQPDKLTTHYFTFGKLVWRYMEAQGFASSEPEAAWDILQQTLQQLETPTYYLISHRDALAFSLLPFGEIESGYKKPVKAINDFFYRYSSTQHLNSKKNNLLKTLRDKIKAGNSYLIKNKSKLDVLQNDTHYQLWGDLVMANMHAIKQGVSAVTLTSFYDGQPVVIKLKEELSPQKNAEIFYRKAKNQQIEIDKLRETITNKEEELIQLQAQATTIENTSDSKKLPADADNTLSAQQKNVHLPYYEFVCKGYKIWVGKNAIHNDTLTLKYGYKEDLWLHVKDVAGSHVLIKHQAGKNFPKDVIERAAELAAYNSKRKTDSLVPVIVTSKKFVRKRKGDPAGAVVVEKEKIIMVEPKL